MFLRLGLQEFLKNLQLELNYQMQTEFAKQLTLIQRNTSQMK